MGRLQVTDISEYTKYEYIDYIYGGMSLSLFMAIDFTIGNLSYKNPYSLHYLPEDRMGHHCSDSEDESLTKKKKKNKESDFANMEEKKQKEAALA